MILFRSGSDDFTFVLQVMIPGPPHLSMVIGWARTNKAQNGDNGSDTSADANDHDPFEASLLRSLNPVLKYYLLNTYL